VVRSIGLVGDSVLVQGKAGALLVRRRDLQENGAFWRSKYFLKVALKLKELQFTFSELVGLVGPLRDTGK
jgi:hypothetical protein